MEISEPAPEFCLTPIALCMCPCMLTQTLPEGNVYGELGLRNHEKTPLAKKRSSGKVQHFVVGFVPIKGKHISELSGIQASEDLWSAPNSATVYYILGTSGWGVTYGGCPTALWLPPFPLIVNNGFGFGIQTNGFGFTIFWATNVSVAVEACTNINNSTWQAIQTNTITGGSSYFSDPQWSNFPARFYRLRWPCGGGDLKKRVKASSTIHIAFMSARFGHGKACPSTNFAWTVRATQKPDKFDLLLFGAGINKMLSENHPMLFPAV